MGMAGRSTQTRETPGGLAKGGSAVPSNTSQWCYPPRFGYQIHGSDSSRPVHPALTCQSMTWSNGIPVNRGSVSKPGQHIQIYIDVTAGKTGT